MGPLTGELVGDRTRPGSGLDLHLGDEAHAGGAGSVTRPGFPALPGLGRRDLRMAQDVGVAVEHLAEPGAVLVGEDAGHAAGEILLEIGLVPAEGEGGVGEGDASLPEHVAEVFSGCIGLHRALSGVWRRCRI